MSNLVTIQKPKGFADRNTAVIIDDGTLMEDTAVTMESATAFMGGATNPDKSTNASVSIFKPKGKI